MFTNETVQLRNLNRSESISVCTPCFANKVRQYTNGLFEPIDEKILSQVNKMLLVNVFTQPLKSRTHSDCTGKRALLRASLFNRTNNMLHFHLEICE